MEEPSTAAGGRESSADHKGPNLKTPAKFLRGVGPNRAEKLVKLGIRTAQDLLFLFPRSYESPAPPKKVDQLVEGQPAAMVGTVSEAELVSRNAGKSVFGALVETESGFVRLMFFNQPFRADTLPIGCELMFSGSPKLNGLRWEFVHPKVTVLGKNESVPTPKPLPVYPLVEGLHQRDLRAVTAEISKTIAGELEEVLPDWLRKRAADHLRTENQPMPNPLPAIDDALRSIHAPQNDADIEPARMRFIFQELFVMQLAIAIRRQQSRLAPSASPILPAPEIDQRIRRRMPFDLTRDQNDAILEIMEDLAKPVPMNRLLQGDVGSGKTAVAIYASMAVAAVEKQTILMAPTEVLARQHFHNFEKILKGSKVKAGLFVGSDTAKQRKQCLEQMESGEIKILVGTHSLIQNQIQFDDLALAIIDEQHKFGVQQRIATGGDGKSIHSLIMSATPIPRSLGMTMFGDTDISIIREKPSGRAEVNTYLVERGGDEKWWPFVRKKIDEGRQAFVIAPRVGERPSEQAQTDQSSTTETYGNEDDLSFDSDREEAESAPAETSSVLEIAKRLEDTALQGCRIEILHGRMNSEEKQAVMDAFERGEIHVLVSTTVVEVGVDVPNATVMTILGAQHFGLAQLHQLRGRVNRGSFSGHVAVFTDGDVDPTENDRLVAFRDCDDGFELAEIDFQLRGPGDLLGKAQSGLPPLRVANLSRDVDAIVAAKKLATEIVQQDPELNNPELQGLREQVMRRYGKRMDLGTVA